MNSDWWRYFEEMGIFLIRGGGSYELLVCSQINPFFGIIAISVDNVEWIIYSVPGMRDIRWIYTRNQIKGDFIITKF